MSINLLKQTAVVSLPGFLVGMVKVLYTAGATGGAAGGWLGSGCDGLRWGRRTAGARNHGRGGRGRAAAGNVAVAVSRGHVLLVVLGRRDARIVVRYVALGHGYVGGGRAQRVGQRGHAGEAHYQTADRGYFVHVAQVFDALAHVQHVLGPGQALQPVQLLLGLAERARAAPRPGHQRRLALAHPAGRVLRLVQHRRPFRLLLSALHVLRHDPLEQRLPRLGQVRLLQAATGTSSRRARARVAPGPLGGRRRRLLGHHTSTCRSRRRRRRRRRRFPQVGQPRVFQTLFGRQPFPGVPDQQLADEVHGISGHVFEQFVREVDVRVWDVAKRLLVRVAAEWTESRQQGVRGHSQRPACKQYYYYTDFWRKKNVLFPSAINTLTLKRVLNMVKIVYRQRKNWFDMRWYVTFVCELSLKYQNYIYKRLRAQTSDTDIFFADTYVLNYIKFKKTRCTSLTFTCNRRGNIIKEKHQFITFFF